MIDAHSYQLPQEMELGEEDEEEVFNSLAEETVELTNEEEEDVVFSPYPSITEPAGVTQVIQQKRWGPVQA